MTAELTVVAMAPDDARTVTDQIKVAVEATWHLIVQAYQGRAWAALGYASWDDYCTREFGTARLRLPREERQEVVASLRDSGLSIRAIAAATGAAKGTIERDVQVSQSRTPAPAGAGISKWERHAVAIADYKDALAELRTSSPTATSEKDYIAKMEAAEAAGASPAQVIEAAFGDMFSGMDGGSEPDPAPEPEPKTITGTDGKAYPADPAPKPRRSALIDDARNAGWQLRKAVERLERIATDDRYPNHQTRVATEWTGHLTYAIDACQHLLDGLTQETPAPASTDRDRDRGAA